MWLCCYPVSWAPRTHIRFSCQNLVLDLSDRLIQRITIAIRIPMSGISNPANLSFVLGADGWDYSLRPCRRAVGFGRILGGYIPSSIAHETTSLWVNGLLVSISVTIVQKVTRIALGDLGNVIFEGPMAPFQHPVRICPEGRDVVGAEGGTVGDTASRDCIFGSRHRAIGMGNPVSGLDPSASYAEILSGKLLPGKQVLGIPVYVSFQQAFSENRCLLILGGISSRDQRMALFKT